MDKYIAILCILTLFSTPILAQGFVWGPKGGLSLAQQSTKGYQRDILTAWHGDMYIESLSEEDKYALFASIGYHQRGSAFRTQSFIGQNGSRIPARTRKSVYDNAVLQLGGKQKFYLGPWSKWYFGVALRGEYNLSVELAPEVYPSTLEDRVTKFVYGVTANIGVEHMFTDLVGVLLEFNVMPDFSDQLIIPAQPAFGNPNRIIPENRVRNVTYEITLGFRFLRKVIYE